MSPNCPINTQTELRIGDVPVRNRAFLAPMSGVTDIPFRKLAWRFGAGMVVSEMVASEALVTGQQEMQLKAESAGLPVHMVQLAGRKPEWMAFATKVALDAGADIIDINMGCPSKRVTNGYSGSALMRDLDNAMRLIDAVVETSNVPVTLKMRLGWDEQSINAPELAERAEAAGISLITVHGRTRNQFYKGQADWHKVRAVRECISVPLIVNGDIASVADAQNAIEASGADAVMIGRATYGAPWLVGEIGAALQNQAWDAGPADDELAGIVADHYEQILGLYGLELGIRNARKHLGWYLDRLGGNQAQKALRSQMMTSCNPAEVLQLIDRLFSTFNSIGRAA